LRASRKEVGELAQKHFSDVEGTLKFLSLAALVVAVVLGCAFWFSPKNLEKSPHAENAENFSDAEFSGEKKSALAQENSPDGNELSDGEFSEPVGVARFSAALEKRIELGDFAGAAEIWTAFAETFPQEAERVRGVFLPRFKLKTADAFASRVSRLMLSVDCGGTLSPEEKKMIRAELAMFARVRRELGLTDGRVQRKNLEIFERAAALAEEDNSAESNVLPNASR